MAVLEWTHRKSRESRGTTPFLALARIASSLDADTLIARILFVRGQQSVLVVA